jgi:hypothetical protein
MDPRLQSRQTPAYVIGVAGVLLCAAACAWYWMPVIRARQQHRAERTERALNWIDGELYYHGLSHGSLPGPTYQDAVRALRAAGTDFDDSDRQLRKNGQDAWGRDLIYEWRSPNEVRVRSAGPNGIDEFGKGDDIQRITRIPVRKT